MQPLRIYLEHISKTFVHRVKGRVKAVDDVVLEVLPGELLTLLGPSGCGKTTTLRMIAGFEAPSQGRIFFGDDDVTDLMVNQRSLGFVFQNYALFPHLSIFENVVYGLRVKKLSGPEIIRNAGEVLRLVGLEGYEQQFPNQLSGGEQQRVALARAIVIKPQVLLFDEPLSNLDAKLRVRTRGEIRRLQKNLRITSIYVTHDQEEAMAISDRIAVMNQGRIIQIGTAEELYFKPRTEFVAKFIGKINTLPARVTELSSAGLTLTIFGHAFCLAAPVSWISAPGDLKVYVRPEMVRLTANPASAHFQARIVERTFLGEKIEYGVDAGGATLSVSAPAASAQNAFALQQAVGVILDTENLMLLPGEEPTP
jgi:ABC-type Fe3+/spermidine/putrescine transport system ATPase subunit